MKSVEFIGPSGVGKTTLKTALLTADDMPPLLDQVVMPLAVMRPDALARGMRALSRSRYGLARRAAHAASGVVARRFRAHALRNDWDAQWSGFLAAAAGRMLSAPRQGNLAASRLVFLVDCLAQAHFARSETAIDGIALLDEGVLQRCVSVAQMIGPEDPDAIRRVFELCPLPDAVILLAADPETVRRRIAGRTDSKPYHAAETDAALLATRICSDLLEARGIPTLRLDAGSDRLPDLQTVREFLKRVAA